MNSIFFETCFTERLLPELPLDAVIVMDNASFHRKAKLYEIAKKHNRKLVFLPPYSPELNHIERFWHWLKRKVSEFLRIPLNLEQAIYHSFIAWLSHIIFK